MMDASTVPRQSALSWGLVFRISFASMRRRMMRSIVTVSCVVLALAFLSYMLVLTDIIEALVAMNHPTLNATLQEHGIDIYADTQSNPMNTLLISLALVTCTVGIANSMLMSVTERIREIGTLKCLGARDRFILRSYLVESSMQGLCGAVLGVTLGLVVAVVVSFATYSTFVFQAFPLLSILSSLSISLVCGLLIAIGASVWPAKVAAKKRPVDALRVEE